VTKPPAIACRHLPDNVRTHFTLFNNAALVQLGLNDTNRIDIERVGAPASPP
jgi:hypothetical protein